MSIMTSPATIKALDNITLYREDMTNARQYLAWMVLVAPNGNHLVGLARLSEGNPIAESADTREFSSAQEAHDYLRTRLTAAVEDTRHLCGHCLTTLEYVDHVCGELLK